MFDQFEHLKTALADRYVIERELGEGGMATVYLAHDVKHDREVAVKVMRPEIAAALGSDRFLREIRLAAKLQHPHILCSSNAWPQPVSRTSSLRRMVSRSRSRLGMMSRMCTAAAGHGTGAASCIHGIETTATSTSSSRIARSTPQ